MLLQREGSMIKFLQGKRGRQGPFYVTFIVNCTLMGTSLFTVNLGV